MAAAHCKCPARITGALFLLTILTARLPGQTDVVVGGGFVVPDVARGSVVVAVAAGGEFALSSKCRRS
jgi:hypothetical protein